MFTKHDTRYPIPVLFLLGFAGLLPAQKHDNVWPGGLNEYPGTPGNGQYLIRFDQGQPEVEPAALGLNFESTVAALSDSSGHLLYYTNGCAIYDASGDSILNGSGLNPGVVADLSCASTGYISPRGAMFLPWPDKEAEYCFLLHMGMDYAADRGLTYGPFYASFISRAGGQPNVFYKNEVFLLPDYTPADTRTFEPFSVVRHGNGRDWWLVVPERRRNVYHVFLIRPQGIFEQPTTQSIGPGPMCTRVGSSTFSPDGSKYARQENCGVVVMDFDRCTGQFSSPQWLPLPGSAFGGGGVVFSPDNTQLITDDYLTILKADLTDANPAFDTLIDPADILGTSLHHLQYGPDGRLYFSSLQRVDHLPTLSDAFGPNPVFEQQGVLLPVHSVRGLPYFPNYRLYDFADSPCDTLGIDTPLGVDQTQPAASVSAFPNPVSDTWRLSCEPPAGEGEVVVFDFSGRPVWRGKTTEQGVSVDVHTWPDGMYFWQIRQANECRAGSFVKI